MAQPEKLRSQVVSLLHTWLVEALTIPLRFKGKGIKKFEEYFFETPTGGNDICMLRNILAFTERKRQIQAVRGTDRSIVTNHMIFLKVWYQCDKRGVIFSTCNLLKQKILYFV